jgi:hypothetical protein
MRVKIHFKIDFQTKIELIFDDKSLLHICVNIKDLSTVF